MKSVFRSIGAHHIIAGDHHFCMTYKRSCFQKSTMPEVFFLLVLCSEINKLWYFFINLPTGCYIGLECPGPHKLRQQQVSDKGLFPTPGGPGRKHSRESQELPCHSTPVWT
eukprot:Blabericola_migrator_1__6217@NODE_3138_length_2012_cov_20_640103_g1964_i0_p2_GENE_NODE_3138_length_2012_cov_20_640103_g1964_i0NODE_3138_length_2012_cov_20_640103_g1964_i0_p2_ORF_typecomplete_len111_score2_42Arena_glycoprot/PF00798_18/0_037_NODE_3138_length_2012_cov_20_640103_g1964_i014271759